VHALDLPAETGFSEETIVEAYDDVMRFCLHGGEFSTGELCWTEVGKTHFADVGVLFRLDLWVLGCSAAALAVLLLLSRRIRPARPLGRGASFWAGCGVLALFAAIAVWGAQDFDRAFTVFHHIFFPGKTNWLFDPDLDQIILILPEVFFRNCAILAIGIIAMLCVVYILVGRKRK
jgi:integral membrane protein (TIGR01906 family)